jgi:hypothetical protein
MAQKLISVVPEVYEKIKSLADENHRTIMGEVAYLLEYYLKSTQKCPPDSNELPEGQGTTR